MFGRANRFGWSFLGVRVLVNIYFLFLLLSTKKRDFRQTRTEVLGRLVLIYWLAD